MRSVSQFVGSIVDLIIQPLIILITAVALVYFVWGLVQFILHSDDSTTSAGGSVSYEGREKGKRHLIWGIVGLLIIVGAVSILGIVTNTFCGSYLCR